MKKNMGVLKTLLQYLAGSSFIFAIVTLLSSTNRRINEIPDFVYVQRGFPFKFVLHTNQITSVDYRRGIMDYLIILFCVVMFQFLFVQYKGVYGKRIIKNFGILIAVFLLFFSHVQYGYAATIKVMSWRLMKSGRLNYSVASEYKSYVKVAQNTWNKYKPGVIKENSLNCDITIRGSGNLGYGINGVTYKKGAIYFNTVTWAMELRDAEKKNCAIHEMGHALGLDHNNSSDKNIMYPNTTRNCTLSANDKASYEASFALSFAC